MLKPIKVASLASEAFDRVVDAITSGEFEPGEKISESRLARELGISRDRSAKLSSGWKGDWSCGPPGLVYV